MFASVSDRRYEMARRAHDDMVCISEKQLEVEKEIATDIDTLRWDYYQFIQSHPVTKWPFTRSILYGGKDKLQPLESIQLFTDKYQCELTVSKQSDHPFMNASDYILWKSGCLIIYKYTKELNSDLSLY